MKQHERWRGLARSPKLMWDALVRGRYDFTYDLMPMNMPQMPLPKRLNLVKAGANLIHRRLTPWSWPIHMQIELTSYCNLRCPICPIGTGDLTRRPTAMDPGLFERVIDEVGPYLLTTSLWGWGESLLHPQLAEILRIAEPCEVVTLVSTNGQNLNDESVIDALVRHPPSYLIVAIDGLTDETNSKFRVGAKLEPALSGVFRLAEIKEQRGLDLPVLHMRFIVMRHNQHEVPRLRAFAKENRFDSLTTRPLLRIDSCEEPHRQLVPEADELKAYQYEAGEPVPRDDFICMQPFWFPTVLAEGTLVACEQDYNAQQSLGTISDDVSFADLWFSKHAVEVRKLIRDATSTIEFCRSCPYMHDQFHVCGAIEAFDLDLGDER